MTEHPITATLAACLLTIAVVAAGCRATQSTESVHCRPRVGSRRATGRTDRRLDNLDPDLRAAVEAATRAARDDGVELSITSGWRSRDHQERLFDAAVSKYGSEEEAGATSRRPTPRGTSPATRSTSVRPTPTSWLSQHGADYGLCQIYANEVWHFELATTPGGQCPEMYPDSSYRQ